RPAEFDLDVSSFNESNFSKTAAKRLATLREEFRGRTAEKPTYRNRLLSTRRQWPHSRAAEKGDELASSHRHPETQDRYRSDSNLHGGAPPTSALGHKRTCAAQKAMFLDGSRRKTHNARGQALEYELHLRYFPSRSVLMQRSKKDHYSITSSARAISDGGTVRPRALAVLRLMTSSNFVGCSAGISAALAPCRILTTK